MTSAISLSKIMKQHLKEHTWLPVLSLIVQLLAGPVTMLLFEGNIVRNSAYSNNAMREIINNIGDTLRSEHVAAELTVMYVGVLLVAIFGFQYLFSINMTDMVHSAPVKREKLFLGIYINGFLYWFIPNIISNLLIILVTFTQVGYEKGIARLVYIIIKEEAYLVLSFLIVYNIILVAIMISGNIFNALVNTAILGGSVICLFYTFVYACIDNFKTFVEMGIEDLASKVCVLSPVTIPAILMLRVADDYRMVSPFKTDTFTAIGSVVLCIINFFLAMYLYKNRKSELSSRGTKLIPYKIIAESIISVTVGLLGALFMTEMTSNGGELPWGIFGAVVFSALCLGALRIIFNMSFKEFLGRKGRMFFVVLASVLLFLSFRFDWYGYDRYVVDPQDVAKAEICFPNGGDDCIYIQSYDDNSGYYWDYSDRKYIDVKDPAIATAIMNASRDDAYYQSDYYTMILKVTLKNGRTVYRGYSMSKAIVASIKPVVESDEFMHTYYRGVLGEFDDIQYATIQGYFVEYPKGGSKLLDKEQSARFMELYKEDFLDNFSAENLWDTIYTTSVYVTYECGVTCNYYIPNTFVRSLEYMEANCPELLFKITDGWNITDFQPALYCDDSNLAAYEYVLKYQDDPQGMENDPAICYGYKDYSGYYDAGATRFQYAGDIYTEYGDGYRYVEVFVDMTKIQ